MSGSWKKDRRGRAELEYNKAVSEQETIYRDLFGEEELREVRGRFYSEGSTCECYLDFLRNDTERKLKQYD